MVNIRVPPNCTSITFTTSGVKIPVNNIITGLTALEATTACSPYSKGAGHDPVVSQNNANGQLTLRVPAGITSMTIGGNVYAVASGVISAVLPADATAFILGLKQKGTMFELVQG